MTNAKTGNRYGPWKAEVMYFWGAEGSLANAMLTAAAWLEEHASVDPVGCWTEKDDQGWHVVLCLRAE